MSNKLSAVLVLCISTISLSACDLFRATGPCYGVGCPSGAPGRNGQYKQGEGPKAQNASVPASTQTAAAPARTAPAPAAATQPKPVQADATAQPASAPAQTAATQPETVQAAAPAQTASASTPAQ